MSRTVRRKNSDNAFKNLFIYGKDDVDENGLVNHTIRKDLFGMSLEKANKKLSAKFHSCGGPAFNYTAGKYYRQEYRAKSKQQLREQLIVLDDYEGIQIDELCNDWRYWN